MGLILDVTQIRSNCYWAQLHLGRPQLSEQQEVHCVRGRTPFNSTSQLQFGRNHIAAELGWAGKGMSIWRLSSSQQQDVCCTAFNSIPRMHSGRNHISAEVGWAGKGMSIWGLSNPAAACASRGFNHLQPVSVAQSLRELYTWILLARQHLLNCVAAACPSQGLTDLADPTWPERLPSAS